MRHRGPSSPERSPSDTTQGRRRSCVQITDRLAKSSQPSAQSYRAPSDSTPWSSDWRCPDERQTHRDSRPFTRRKPVDSQILQRYEYDDRTAGVYAYWKVRGLTSGTVPADPRHMPHACIVVARTGVARTAAALTITSMHDSHHVLEFLRRKEWW